VTARPPVDDGTRRPEARDDDGRAGLHDRDQQTPTELDQRGAVPSHHDPVAYALLLVMAGCFAGTWVAAHWATDEVPPLTTAFIRFSIASALLWGWGRLIGAPMRLGREVLPLVTAMALLGIVAYNLCFLYGVRLAPASDGAIIVPGLSPVVVALIVAVRYRTVPGRQGIIGLVLALAGLVLVIGPALEGGGERLLGDLLYVTGAFCWAAYSVMSRVATTRLHPVTATLAPAAIGALIFLPTTVWAGWAPVADASPRALASLLYLGALGTMVAFVAFAEGIRRIGAPRASAFIVLVPLAGEMLSVWLLGEHVGPFIVVGSAIVLAGLWLVQTDRPPRTTSDRRVAVAS
jgi:drug/metabolite transporter (DMT)-like permease